MGLFKHLHGRSEKRGSGNLERWIDSGEPKRWVEKHNYSWNHDDWLSLLNSLENSEYWPMKPDEVGAVLEKLKREGWRPAARPAPTLRGSTSRRTVKLLKRPRRGD